MSLTSHTSHAPRRPLVPHPPPASLPPLLPLASAALALAFVLALCPYLPAQAGGIGENALGLTVTVDTVPGLPGPLVRTGAAVVKRYRLVNGGEADLYGVTVTDGQVPGGRISCPARTLAALGSLECTARFPALAGKQVGTVTAQGDVPSLGRRLTASARAGYEGVGGALALAETVRVAGDEAVVSYTVTNRGDRPLYELRLTDTALGAAPGAPGCVTALAPGVSAGCTATVRRPPGSYRSTGRVTGTDRITTLAEDGSRVPPPLLTADATAAFRIPGGREARSGAGAGAGAAGAGGAGAGGAGAAGGTGGTGAGTRTGPGAAVPPAPGAGAVAGAGAGATAGAGAGATAGAGAGAGAAGAAPPGAGAGAGAGAATGAAAALARAAAAAAAALAAAAEEALASSTAPTGTGTGPSGAEEGLPAEGLAPGAGTGNGTTAGTGTGTGNGTTTGTGTGTGNGTTAGTGTGTARPPGARPPSAAGNEEALLPRLRHRARQIPHLGIAWILLLLLVPAAVAAALFGSRNL
ncbi:hypothetical protein ACGFRB_29580 [Streptomyces sp. NPDC048718]|uniref:hypothetical protein n=1 Tax=Streptomyces sp. NPDC048718 TaxID=3365587 RepID=UPI003715C084